MSVELIEQMRDAHANRIAARQALWNKIGAYATPTLAQIETSIDEAKVAATRPLAQWTNVLIVDGIKLSLQIGLFLLARELKRVIENREAD